MIYLDHDRLFIGGSYGYIKIYLKILVGSDVLVGNITKQLSYDEWIIECGNWSHVAQVFQIPFSDQSLTQPVNRFTYSFNIFFV